MTLKRALQQYRLMKPMEPNQEETASIRLYKLSIGSEKLGLISNILQRITRVQLAEKIDARRDDILHQKIRKRSALKQALRMIVFETQPKVQSWEDDEDAQKRAAYKEVEENLQRWRSDNVIRSYLRTQFIILSILLLMPHGVHLSADTSSISGIMLVDYTLYYLPSDWL